MPTYRYKAVDPRGKNVKGLVDAESAAQAGETLKARGIVPLDLVPVSGRAASRGGAGKGGGLRQTFSGLRRGVPAAVVASSFRQFATLLSAGLPLDSSLASMIGKGGGKGGMPQILAQVRDAVREGGDLASAMEAHPRVFSPTAVSMVRAGEASGTLDVVMERLAEHAEQQLAMNRKIRAAMAYPIFMLVVGFFVVAFLLAFVVPKITQIFLDMDRALPLPTQLLILMSQGLTRWWPLILLGICALALGLWRYAATERGRRRLHEITLRLPAIGPVARLMAVGRFCKTLGLLLKNEVSLVPALGIVGTVAGNAVLEEAVRRMHGGVQEGRALWEFLDEAPIFPETAVHMVSAGERTGKLPHMLLVVAKDCELSVESRLQVLMSLLEPAMILVMSLLVGFVVVSILLPIFEMSNLVG